MVTSLRGQANISVPELMTDVPSWLKIIAAKVNQILRGRTNNVGEITLTASATSTNITVAVGTFGDKTVFVFMPITNNAADHYNNKFYVSANDPRAGTYTVTHSSAPHTDLTYRVAYVG
jgi:hypothetical protein